MFYKYQENGKDLVISIDSINKYKLLERLSESQEVPKESTKANSSTTLIDSTKERKL